MSEDRTGRLLNPKRKYRRKGLAHFAVTARVDKAHPTTAKVTIDRARGMVTMRRARSRRVYTITLATLVELGMARIMKLEAERMLGSKR